MEFRLLSKVAVVLGAGASKDVVGAARVLDATWTPPLAKELFTNPAKEERIEMVLGRYEGAVVVRERLSRGAAETEFRCDDDLRNKMGGVRGAPGGVRLFGRFRCSTRNRGWCL